MSMHNVVPLHKSVRRDDAMILSMKMNVRYSPLLRVGINRVIGQKNPGSHLSDASRRLVNGAAKEWANFYRWFHLDVTGQQSINEVMQHTSDDMDLIINQSQGIRDGEALRLMNDAEWTPTDKKKMLTQIKGLDYRSAKALVNYRTKLLTSKQPYPKSEINDSVRRYREDMLRRRGNLIATTETNRALNEAHMAVIQVAALEGLVELETSTKTWLTRAAACQVCAPLNQKSVAFFSAWPTQVGIKYQPPAHPNCRCTFVLNPARPGAGV